MKHSKAHRFTVQTVLCGIILVALGVLWSTSQPQFSDAHVSFGDSDPTVIPFPIRQDSTEKMVFVELAMEISALSPRTYFIVQDDCISTFWVNDVRVRDAEFCDLEGKIVDLSAVLHLGDNTVRVEMKDFGGSFMLAMNPAWYTLPFLILLCILIVGAWLVLSVLGRRQALRPETVLLWIIAMAALAVRLLYTAATLFLVRAYDWNGHIEYIDYIAQYLWIPPAQDGWQFYQPPLYYFVTGGWMRIGQEMGLSMYTMLLHIQWLSWTASAVGVFCIIWMSRLLFPTIVQRGQRLLFVAVCSFFPGLVFFSSRISNDVLLLPVALLSFALLLRWWQKTTMRNWTLLWIILSLGLLVKSTILPLLVVALLCALIAKNLAISVRLRLLLRAVVLVTVIAGWLFVIRYGVEGERSLVGNKLNERMRVENTISSLLTFNAIEVIRRPFNNNRYETGRRQFFWESLFKSAFTGEWDFGDTVKPLLILLLLCSLVALPIILIGLVQDLLLDPRTHVPVWLTLLALLGAALAYRWTSPYSANQDFRFIPVVIVPLVYYGVRGLHALPPQAKRIGSVLAAVFVVLCIAFVLLLLPL